MSNSDLENDGPVTSSSDRFVSVHLPALTVVRRGRHAFAVISAFFLFAVG
jgi:hypothetical protein